MVETRGEETLPNYLLAAVVLC